MTKNPSAHKDEELLEADRRKYEVMAIIDPDVGSVDYKKDFDALKSLVENHGGSIWNEEEWGKRELAYSIKKKDHGFYVVIDFDADPSQIPEIIRQLKITPFVVRFLLVQLPDNYTAQHYDLDEALQEQKPVKEEEEKPKAKKPAKKAAKPKVEEPTPEPEPEEEPAPEPAQEPEEEEVEPEPEPTPEPEKEVEKPKEKPKAKPKPEPKEEPKPEEEPKPKKKVKLDDLELNNSEKLSKLDKRLEELLSGKDDLNL